MKLETQVGNVQQTVNKIDQKLEVLIPTFVTESQVAVLKEEFNEKYLELKTELINSKKRSALQNWVTGTLSAVFGAIMAILIQSYLSQ